MAQPAGRPKNMRQETLRKYKKQVKQIQAIENYTIADIKRITHYPWFNFRDQLEKYGLHIDPPIDSQEVLRQNKFDQLKAAFDRTGNANRISLDKARQILGCERAHHARLQLDTMEKYGFNIQALVSYTPISEMDKDEEDDEQLDKRRQPEPLRVAGLPVKKIEDKPGWYQFI